MKKILTIIANILKGIAGILGGSILGILISLILLHCKGIHTPPLPPLLWLSPLIIVIMAIIGGVYSNKFMWLFLCPIGWILSDHSVNTGHPTGDERERGLHVVVNISYFLGLVSLIAGVALSKTQPVIFGIGGIAYFIFETFKNDRGTGS